MKEKIISCCGVICSDCQYYPGNCSGCPAIEGKAFWLQFTGSDVCDIYNCCINQKQLSHCGKCSELPCAFYGGDDPTKSEAENRAIFERQMAVLADMK